MIILSNRNTFHADKIRDLPKTQPQNFSLEVYHTITVTLLYPHIMNMSIKNKKGLTLHRVDIKKALEEYLEWGGYPGGFLPRRNNMQDDHSDERGRFSKVSKYGQKPEVFLFYWAVCELGMSREILIGFAELEQGESSWQTFSFPVFYQKHSACNSIINSFENNQFSTNLYSVS